MFETLIRSLLDPLFLWALLGIALLFSAYRITRRTESTKLRSAIILFIGITLLGSNSWLAALAASNLEDFGLKNSAYADASLRAKIPCQEFKGVVALGGVISNIDFDPMKGISLLSGAERVTVPVELSRICPNFTLIYSSFGANPKDVNQSNPKNGETKNRVSSATIVVGESELAAQVWRSLGVDVKRIRIDNSSSNTYENAREVSRMLAGQQGRWLLVTSAVHMKRAAATFEKAGIEVEPIPVDYIWNSRPSVLSFAPEIAASSWRAVAHEYIGILYYKIKGWI